MTVDVFEDKELLEAVKLFMESLGRLAAYIEINGAIGHVKGVTLMTNELVKVYREENKCKKLH